MTPLHSRAAEPRYGPRIVDGGPPPLRFLDWLDSVVVVHRFYNFCSWLALHPGWRPTSAAHLRPDGKPFYLDPNCPHCGTPLVLLDSLEDPPLSPDKVWYDEWVCPNWLPPNGDAWMDWPKGHLDPGTVRQRSAEAASAGGDNVTLEELEA